MRAASWQLKNHSGKLFGSIFCRIESNESYTWRWELRHWCRPVHLRTPEWQSPCTECLTVTMEALPSSDHLELKTIHTQARHTCTHGKLMHSDHIWKSNKKSSGILKQWMTFNLVGLSWIHPRRQVAYKSDTRRQTRKITKGFFFGETKFLHSARYTLRD